MRLPTDGVFVADVTHSQASRCDWQFVWLSQCRGWWVSHKQASKQARKKQGTKTRTRMRMRARIIISPHILAYSYIYMHIFIPIYPLYPHSLTYAQIEITASRFGGPIVYLIMATPFVCLTRKVCRLKSWQACRDRRASERVSTLARGNWSSRWRPKRENIVQADIETLLLLSLLLLSLLLYEVDS